METGDHPDDVVRHLAEAEAALVLAESLVHTLLTKGVLQREEVVSAIESAAQVKRQMASDGSAPRISHRAAGILTRLANTVAAENRARDE